MLDLKIKNYFIAGLSTSDGIAAGIGRLLRQCGAGVWYSALSPEMKEEALRANPGIDSEKILTGNFKFEKSMQTMINEITRLDVKFDGAVNATGYADPGEMEEPLRESSWEAMEEAHAINVIGSRFFFLGLRPSLADTASLLALTYHPGAAFAVPGYHLMGIQKAALESLVRYLARDYGETMPGVRVNALSPGILPTRSARAVKGFEPGIKYEAMLSPQKRNIKMEEAAAEAVWLLSPYSSGTNGQVRIVDSGFLACSLDPEALNNV